jgi:putative lipase involved disintegration of autophagic bodies
MTVVTFRGTDDRADWGVNLDFIANEAEHGKEHRGFRRAFDSMKDDLFGRIRAAKAEKVWLTGHSLGGALAAMCAMDLLKDKDIPLHGVMTFGQPMVSHKELADFMDKQLHSRFVHFANQGDYIPR